MLAKVLTYYFNIFIDIIAENTTILVHCKYFLLHSAILFLLLSTTMKKHYIPFLARFNVKYHWCCVINDVISQLFKNEEWTLRLLQHISQTLHNLAFTEWAYTQITINTPEPYIYIIHHTSAILSHWFHATAMSDRSDGPWRPLIINE
jgi:hypothetical protein